MKYLLEGDERTVNNIIKEQRFRVQRGLVTITPIDDDKTVASEVHDEKEIPMGDSKEVDATDKKDAPKEDTKKPKTKK